MKKSIVSIELNWLNGARLDTICKDFMRKSCNLHQSKVTLYNPKELSVVESVLFVQNEKDIICRQCKVRHETSLPETKYHLVVGGRQNVVTLWYSSAMTSKEKVKAFLHASIVRDAKDSFENEIDRGCKMKSFEHLTQNDAKYLKDLDRFWPKFESALEIAGWNLSKTIL